MPCPLPLQSPSPLLRSLYPSLWDDERCRLLAGRAGRGAPVFVPHTCDPRGGVGHPGLLLDVSIHGRLESTIGVRRRPPAPVRGGEMRFDPDNGRMRRVVSLPPGSDSGGER